MKISGSTFRFFLKYNSLVLKNSSCFFGDDLAMSGGSPRDGKAIFGHSSSGPFIFGNCSVISEILSLPSSGNSWPIFGDNSWLSDNNASTFGDIPGNEGELISVSSAFRDDWLIFENTLETLCFKDALLVRLLSDVELLVLEAKGIENLLFLLCCCLAAILTFSNGRVQLHTSLWAELAVAVLRKKLTV